MSKSSSESPLNSYQFSLRQLFLWMHIVAVACSAFVGTGQILVGEFRDFRVLWSAVTIALASVCALGCGAALEGKRAIIFPIAGLVLTLVGTLMQLLMIWNVLPQGVSFQHFCNWTLFFCINAVACSHISLLSMARLSKRFRWSISLAVISIITVASLLSALLVVPDPYIYGFRLFRFLALASIFDAAMSVLIPVFHLLSYGEINALDSGIESTHNAIDAEIAQLESRLVNLRQLRSKSEGSGLVDLLGSQ
jgi:hypothetical protein